MPFMLLAIVYVPLRKALDEVAWQIRVRATVQESLQRIPVRVVQSRVRVERGEIDLGLVLLGTAAQADAVRENLRTGLEGKTGVLPAIDVLAIPDASAFEHLEASLKTKPPVAPPPVPQLDALREARKLVQSAVERRWPATTAGPLLGVSLRTDTANATTVTIAHLGVAIDAAARETLERALSDDLGQAVTISSVFLPAESLAPNASDLSFVASVTPFLELAKGFEAVRVCVDSPVPEKQGRLHDLLTVFEKYPRVTVAAADQLRVRFVRGECPVPEGSTPPQTGTETAKNPAL
jgi:hypothetical protein